MVTHIPIALGAALLLTVCGRDKPLTGPMSKDALAAYQACTQNSDCVHGNNGCCDCANGGEDVAVNKTRAAAFKAAFTCSGVGCTEIGGQCGQGTVACEAGLCVYRP